MHTPLRIVPVALAIAMNAAVEAASAPGVNPSNWQVETKVDSFRETRSVTAKSKHPTVNGGTMYVTASCDGKEVRLDFEYHARTEALSFYDRSGTNQVVRVNYRIDSSPERLAAWEPRYKNIATVFVGYPPPPPANAAESHRKALEVLAAWGPIDMHQFFNAQVVRFELPLGGGLKDVTSINPQNREFRTATAQCGLPQR